MDEGIKIATLFVILSIGFVYACLLIFMIVHDVLRISLDKENSGYIKWNRLNTAFVSKFLSPRAIERRKALGRNTLKFVCLFLICALVIMYIET